MPTVIAVDAMGSDRAPKPEVEGAILAARHYDVQVLLVGRDDLIRAELAHHLSARWLPIEIVQASEVIGMQEKAAVIEIIIKPVLGESLPVRSLAEKIALKYNQKEVIVTTEPVPNSYSVFPN